MFPAARKTDPITHDLVAPTGLIGLPVGGLCPMGLVTVELLPAAHIACTVVCTGATTAVIVHPPAPIPPSIIGGSATVRIHGLPASRWLPSGDIGGCGVLLGDLKLAATRTTLIGGPSLTVKVAGTATAADAVLVVRELDRLPPYLLELIANNHIALVVCRGSITEYRPDLRGVQPRGWRPGTTWDTVPGARVADTGEVVIAVIGHGTAAGPHVPTTGEGHGSANVVIHETLHAVDASGIGGNRSSSDAGFNGARNSDLGALGGYETQVPQTGQKETYAESAARYYGGDPNDAANHPNLHNYWAGEPLRPHP